MFELGDSRICSVTERKNISAKFYHYVDDWIEYIFFSITADIQYLAGVQDWDSDIKFIKKKKKNLVSLVSIMFDD